MRPKAQEPKPKKKKKMNGITSSQNFPHIKGNNQKSENEKEKKGNKQKIDQFKHCTCYTNSGKQNCRPPIFFNIKHYSP